MYRNKFFGINIGHIYEWVGEFISISLTSEKFKYIKINSKK